MRKTAIALGTVGVGAGILYALRRKNTGGWVKKDAAIDKVRQGVVDNQIKPAPASGLKPTSQSTLNEDYEIDDRGTGQNEAAEILTKIKDDAFDSSDEKFALALGRPVEEIQAFAKRERRIDSDVLMKARALASERGLRLEDLG